MTTAQHEYGHPDGPEEPGPRTANRTSVLVKALVSRGWRSVPVRTLTETDEAVALVGSLVVAHGPAPAVVEAVAGTVRAVEVLRSPRAGERPSIALEDLEACPGAVAVDQDGDQWVCRVSGSGSGRLLWREPGGQWQAASRSFLVYATYPHFFVGWVDEGTA